MSNYRYDAFADTLDPVALTERHVIPTASPFVVRLSEVPHKGTPSTIVMRTVAALTAAVSTEGETSVTVSTGGWFAVNDVIKIDNEQMLVTAIATNVLTVTRGYNSTTAATHALASPVYGATWSEVAATPASRQYWPDYASGADEDANWNTGTILFNAADAGKLVEVAYDGTGTLASIDAPLSHPEWMHDYGDGSDGHFIAAGGETLSGLKQYKSVIIPEGKTVTVGSWPLVVKSQGAVVIGGMLNCKGLDGETNTGVVGAGRGGGGNGGIGETAGGNGTGGGGGGNSGGAQGASSIWGLLNSTVAAAGASPSAASQALMIAGALLCLPAGAGGAGAAGGFNAAGGGGGGGVVVLCAKNAAVSGDISVAGGAAGEPTGQSVSYGTGGGGGGAVVIIAPEISVSGGIDVRGGDGGDGYSAIGSTSGGAGWYKIVELEG